MDERNVSKGVVKSTLGDQTRYLVTAKCPKTGEPSAIHTLMSQNLENPSFFKGKYSATKGKFKPTTVSGKCTVYLNLRHQFSKILGCLQACRLLCWSRTTMSKSKIS